MSNPHEQYPGWWLARQRARIDYDAQARAAADETSAEVLVVVGCAAPECGKKAKRLGEVRSTSQGLLFESRLSAKFPSGTREAIADGFRNRGAGWLPIPVAVERCLVLLERDAPEGTDAPRVECQKCGESSVSPLELVAAAKRSGRHPVWVTVQGRQSH